MSLPRLEYSEPKPQFFKEWKIFNSEGVDITKSKGLISLPSYPISFLEYEAPLIGTEFIEGWCDISYGGGGSALRIFKPKGVASIHMIGTEPNTYIRISYDKPTDINSQISLSIPTAKDKKLSLGLTRHLDASNNTTIAGFRIKPHLLQVNGSNTLSSENDLLPFTTREMYLKTKGMDIPEYQSMSLTLGYQKFFIGDYLREEVKDETKV